MAGGAKLEHLFATPIILDRVDHGELPNSELEAAILERRRVHPGIRRSNLGSWHSDLNLFDWGGEPASRLAARIVALAEAETVDRSREGAKPEWQVEGWANVTEAGGSNAPHVHPGCFWSAVYYLRVDPGEGGELLLFDPRMPAITMQAPDLRFRHAGGEQVARHAPFTGSLIVFPSWLTHSVTPWQGQGVRMSVAINLSAVTRPRDGLVDASRLTGYQQPQVPPERKES